MEALNQSVGEAEVRKFLLSRMPMNFADSLMSVRLTIFGDLTAREYARKCGWESVLLNFRRMYD